MTRSTTPSNDDSGPVDGVHTAFVEIAAQALFALPRPRTQEMVNAAMPSRADVTWGDLEAIGRRWAELERVAGYATPGMIGSLEIVR